MKYASLILVAMAFAASPAFAQKKMPVPELLQRALIPPASMQLYAYDFEDVSTNTVNKDPPETTTVRGRIDPSRKKGDRVTIVSAEGIGNKKPVNLKKLDQTYEKTAEKAEQGDLFCDTLSMPDVTNVADNGSTTDGRAFSFTPKPEPTAESEMKDMAKKMIADVVIDEAAGVIRSYDARLTKKHSMMLIAEIKAAELKAECALAPNGRAYTARSEFSATASAFGQTFVNSTVQVISNLTPVG